LTSQAPSSTARRGTCSRSTPVSSTKAVSRHRHALAVPQVPRVARVKSRCCVREREARSTAGARSRAARGCLGSAFWPHLSCPAQTPPSLSQRDRRTGRQSLSQLLGQRQRQRQRQRKRQAVQCVVHALKQTHPCQRGRGHHSRPAVSARRLLPHRSLASQGGWKPRLESPSDNGLTRGRVVIGYTGYRRALQESSTSCMISAAMVRRGIGCLRQVRAQGCEGGGARNVATHAHVADSRE